MCLFMESCQVWSHKKGSNVFFGVRLTVLVEFLIPLARINKLLNVTAVGFSSWSERETDQWLSHREKQFLVPKH